MLLDDLKAVAAFTTGRQQKFFQYMIEKATPIYCEPMEKVLPKELLLDIKYLRIEEKQCYRNATFISLIDKNIHYVEGRVSVFGIPIEHAWNEYKGKYFDATFEVALNDNPADSEYLQLGVWNSEEVMDIITETGVYGNLVIEHYKRTQL